MKTYYFLCSLLALGTILLLLNGACTPAPKERDTTQDTVTGDVSKEDEAKEDEAKEDEAKEDEAKEDLGKADLGGEDLGKDLGQQDLGGEDLAVDQGTQDVSAEDVADTASSYHPAEWMNQDNEGFHGKDVNLHGLDSCKSCHGATLDGGFAPACSTCHGSEWKTDCVMCHGGKDNDTGAPPYGLLNEELKNSFHVGAHTTHVKALTPNPTHLDYDCTECHTKPADVFSSGHLDGNGRAEVTFTHATLTQNQSGAYDGATNKCSSLWCHGNGRTIGPVNGILWTSWTGNKSACNFCHGNPPDTGKHENHMEQSYIACATCHTSPNSDGTAIADPTLHINGTVNLKSSLGWNGTSCATAGCHGSLIW